MQKIIFTREGGGMSLCCPSPEALEIYTVVEIALKDVPEGKPFWIVNEENIPIDQSFFDAWELDLEALGEPDGYGMNYKNWEREYRK